MLSLIFFFLCKIYNIELIEFKVYLNSSSQTIKISNNGNLFYKDKKNPISNNENNYYFEDKGKEKDEIVVSSENNGNNQNLQGYIIIEENCKIIIPTNYIIDLYSSDKLKEDEGFKSYSLDKNWKFNFSLYKVPNNCDIEHPLVDLTKDYNDGFHKYYQPSYVEFNQILKLENNDKNDYMKYNLILNNNGNDKDFKLYDQDEKELSLNESIKFRILKIVPFGEYYSHRRIEINFYTIDKDKFYPKSTLSTISFDLCGYGCDCSSSDEKKNYCAQCLENFAYFEDEREYCQEIEKLKSDKYIHDKNSNSFIPCVAPCDTCENKVDNCTSCIEG